MHMVTISLRRAVPGAATIDTNAFAQQLLTMYDIAQVEHARVVTATSRVHIVLFLLAPTYGEAHACALRICWRALDSVSLVGWAVEEHAR